MRCPLLRTMSLLPGERQGGVAADHDRAVGEGKAGEGAAADEEGGRGFEVYHELGEEEQEK